VRSLFACEFASSRLFEALARLSQALASQAPLLMFADDMQWTNAATLDVFQYLARSWTEHETPAMLLLGWRTETRDMEPEMSEWLASLGSSISLTRLEAASAPSVSPSGYSQKRTAMGMPGMSMAMPSDGG
jgi:predicted ATPase